MGLTTDQTNKANGGFTIVELLIVIVVIGILAAIVIVAFNGVTRSARDGARVSKVKAIEKALERYFLANNRYPPIQDAHGFESVCGTQTVNHGHCDRNQELATALAPYMRIDPLSLSTAAPDSVGRNYYYTSPPGPGSSHKMYGLMIYLEGSGGQNDGGFHDDAYEVGNLVGHCKNAYAGALRDWHWASTAIVPTYTICHGGD